VRVLLAHNRYRLAGGEERHVDLLERGLGEAGVDVRRFERASPSDPSRLRRIGLGLGLTYRPAAGREIGRFLDEWPADVVHVHNLLPLLTPSVLRAARHRGAIVVLTAHNYRLFCPAGTLVRDGVVHDGCVEGSSLRCGLSGARGSRVEGAAYGLALELQRRLRLVERWVDAFVAPSEFVARLLVRAGLPADRVHVVRSGVPVADWTPRPREYGLYASRLVPEKGIRTLIAASRLAPEVPLLVAGDGPLADEVREAANGTIRYLGRLGPRELARVQSRAAFSVVPSEWPEPFGLVVPEALAAGTPVISTTAGALGELAGGDGTVVHADGPDALAAAMRALWRRRMEPDFGRSAWETACKQFSLEAQIREQLALYTRLLGARR
jgi:glycosyltransferase involved in cell wall biosynthesis